MNYILGLILIAAGIALHTPLNFELPGHLVINLGETLAMIGFLVLLFPVVKIFYTQPLADAIQERNTELENTFNEVETLRSDMQKLKADYEARLAATEADAREKINSQIKEAQVLRQSLTTFFAKPTKRLLEKRPSLSPTFELTYLTLLLQRQKRWLDKRWIRTRTELS